MAGHVLHHVHHTKKKMLSHKKQNKKKCFGTECVKKHITSKITVLYGYEKVELPLLVAKHFQ